MGNGLIINQVCLNPIEIVAEIKLKYFLFVFTLKFIYLENKFIFNKLLQFVTLLYLSNMHHEIVTNHSRKLKYFLLHQYFYFITAGKLIVFNSIPQL